MSEKDGGSKPETKGGMRPVLFTGGKSEIRGVPVNEFVTQRKSNYADQKDPSEK